MRKLKQILAVFLCAAMALAFIPAAEASNSKSVSIPKGAGEFNGHYYYVYNVIDSSVREAAAFAAAENYCENLGGHLATITSAEENEFVFQFMKEQGYNSAYFGFTDEKKEGTWEWVTGESVQYTNWAPKEPNSESSSEDYAMFYYKYSAGTWNDGNFGGSTVNGGRVFICEWESGEEETLGEIEVEKYDDENGGYTNEYDALFVGDQVRFSIKVTVDENTSLSFKTTNWSCEADEAYDGKDIKAVSFGILTTFESNSSKDDGEGKVYYLSITATLNAAGNHSVIFTSPSGSSKSAQISVRNSKCELGEIEVAKYDEASGNYTGEYDNIYIGDALTFSIEVTTDEGAEMSFDKTNWSCIADEEYDDGKTDALSFGHLSVLGPYASEEKGKAVYYVSIDAEPNLLGKHEVIFTAEDNQEKSAEITVDIKIVFNDEILTFDTQPINKDGNLLVPIYAIADAMGKRYSWNDKYKAALVDNGDSALIVPTYYDGMMSYENSQLLIADEKGYYSWERVRTNVAPTIIDDRTFVPIRQFCEALGAEVDWVDKEKTAYITYDDTESKRMSDSLFDDINLNYYMVHNVVGGTAANHLFREYTTNIIQPFYDSRTQWVDAVAMGIGETGDFFSNLCNHFIYDKTNASMVLQEALYDVINEIPDGGRDVYDVDPSLAKDVASYAKLDKKIYYRLDGIDEAFLKAHPTLKYLDDTVSDLGDLFDFTVFTTEEIAYLLSDYSENMSYLLALEDVFKEACGADYDTSNMKKAVEDLKEQYTNKFYKVVKDVHVELASKTAEESFDAALNSVTGGIYEIGKGVWSAIFKLSGVTGKGDALEKFYAIYSYNAALDSAFSGAMIEEVNNELIAWTEAAEYLPDLDNIRALIQLEIATKKVAIDSIADMANWWAKEDEENAAEELKAELDAFSYYIWTR